jgi:GR25 family glycosyltransferase involved in LPS biosynthesis
LEHRVDRKKKILSELQRVGLTNYEIFKAIKPTEEMVNEWNPNFLNPIPEWFKRTGGDENKYKIGSLGCMLSHLEIIKICIERKYENVLILEDDTEFQIGNGIRFEQVINIMKNQLEHLNFGLFYLAGNHRAIGANLQKKSENVNRVKGTLTTGSYIINKSVMKYILKNIIGYEREIDVFYSTVIQNQFPCYCVHPHITKQGEGYSDIVQKNVSYKLSI